VFFVWFETAMAALGAAIGGYAIRPRQKQGRKVNVYNRNLPHTLAACQARKWIAISPEVCLMATKTQTVRRDSGSGRFITKQQAVSRDPRTWETERIKKPSK
jgi:hypothetical protein